MQQRVRYVIMCHCSKAYSTNKIYKPCLYQYLFIVKYEASYFIYLSIFVATNRSHTKMAEEQSSNFGVHLSSIGSFPQNRHPQRLQSDTALHSNDYNMIDTDQFEYYLEHLWKNITEEKRSSCACLDSLWFSMYKRTVTKEKVLKWIRKKKIFKRKYVFIPIVCWGHWSLLILCNFGENRQPNTEKPCMLLLDSLREADPKRLEPDIRRFVLDICRTEARDEKKEVVYKIPLLVPKVPQQRNGVDCGIFVLYYLHLFAQNAPTNFTLDGYPYFLKEDWFSPDDLENFRKEIHSFESCKKMKLNAH